jgi:hypothetical protein
MQFDPPQPGEVPRDIYGRQVYQDGTFSPFPSQPRRSRLSWLLGLLVTAAVTAGLDYATARWQTTASFLTPMGAVRIDAQQKRGWTGIPYGKRAQVHTGSVRGEPAAR